MDGLLSFVGENLDFDVPGAWYEFLHEQRRVAEGGCRLAAATVERAAHLIGRRHGAHAPAAASRGRLQHYRVADFRCGSGRLLQCRQGVCAAGHHGDVEGSGQGASPHLVAKERQGVGARPDKGQTVRFAELGERRVLREKSVTRMHAVAAGLPGNADERLGVQVCPDGTAAVLAEFPRFGDDPGVQR